MLTRWIRLRARLRVYAAPQAQIITPRQMLRALACAAAAALVLIAGTARQAHAAPAASAGGFPGFIQSLWPKAQARGVSRQTFDAAFEGVTLNTGILKLTRKQAEFVKPIWSYIDASVSPARVEAAQAKRSEWSSWLAKAESQYGVDRNIILGIWGLETNFGAFSGNEYVIRSLATLAYVRYRGDFFRDELITALAILQEGHIRPAEMKGSWAGAMGQTQFMPSSFMDYAVDYDGDGRRDIWTSVPDAIGSTANYLKKHGWISGQSWGYEVILPEGFALTAADQARNADFSAFSQRGVRRADGGALPSSGEAALMLPAGLSGPAFLITPNFKVIKTYNNSTSYALGVALLGARAGGGGGLRTPWPRSAKILNLAQAKDLQRRLKRLGYDIGDIDGKLGDKARYALSAWQAKAGQTPDGFATPAVLEGMRKAR